MCNIQKENADKVGLMHDLEMSCVLYQINDF